jgi:hypothetical protein
MEAGLFVQNGARFGFCILASDVLNSKGLVEGGKLHGQMEIVRRRPLLKSHAVPSSQTALVYVLYL